MSLRNLGKNLVVDLLMRFGYELKISDAPLRGYSTFLTQCRQRGLQVNTVFDAGVGMGTPWLYETFSDKKIVLFESLNRFAPVIEALRSKYDLEAHATALGDEPGEADMEVPREFATSASLKKHGRALLEAIERQGVARTYETETIRISRLDDLNTYEAPYLLKIDVEGYELELLKGAKKTLEETGLIVVETSLIERYENGCTLLDVANFLDARGFVLYEIVEMGVRTHAAPVAFLDAAFVPKTSVLRVL